MPDSTATVFELDPESDVPIWVQLQKRFVHLINSGYYQPGDRIPTVRGLAADLSISYNTVNKAYLALSNDGYITSSRGRGHGAVVNDVHGRGDDDVDAAVDGLVDDCIDACRGLGLSLAEIRVCMMRRLTILESGSAPAQGRPSADGASRGRGDAEIKVNLTIEERPAGRATNNDGK